MPNWLDNDAHLTSHRPRALVRRALTRAARPQASDASGAGQ